ncbi:hypothetical protein [Dethiobacter alkaliphilus]|uniref:Chromatin assembly factor 1-like protein n=1 Tax=Dethiobacter alkaliphilus AHT 1 TaxID=555088 RepID=C0GET8_DETAL|nr:hypothetical protein [Dethiobacter alkaliphilus]EEG78120.1 chromatin assembly factor 1-like protein [Dethiobacter alkaliphilus AHT 1]
MRKDLEYLRKRFTEHGEQIKQQEQEQRHAKQQEKDSIQLQLAQKLYQKMQYAGISPEKKQELKERAEQMEKEYIEKYGTDTDE